jgi:F-type H+-transporting ATPase subunit b
MDQTFRQLGELLLGAVPTTILLALLYFLYTVLVHKPLTAMLAERRARTEGALEKARADVAAADARLAEYEQRLREARMQIFKTLEARRQQASQARSEAAAQARARAHDQVKAARAALEQDKQDASGRLQSEAERLASEIVGRVLRPVSAASPVGGQ